MKTITIDFPGLSLNQVREQNKELFFSQSWYEDELFANDVIPAGTFQVSLEPVKDSMNKLWSEQQILLATGDTVPPAAVLIYAIIQHFKETGERAFEKTFVRTFSIGSDGYRVYVGSFDAHGLDVSNGWDSGSDSSLGLASSREVQNLKHRNLEPLASLNLPKNLVINGVKYIKE